LWQRTAAWYAQLRALPRRLRRALQRQLALPLAGVALVLALGQAPSQAATITVDGTTCTLADAIMAANTDTAQGGCPAGSGADTLVLEPPGGSVTLTRMDNTTYGPTGLPVIRSAITMAGQGGTVRRDPSVPAFRLLAVNGSGDLTLRGVTLTGGLASGWYPSGGGGVLNRGGIVAIEESTIAGNAGGGMVNYNGTATIADSTLSGNAGGGVVNFGYSYGATLTVVQSTITGNDGDGVHNESYIDGWAEVTVIQSVISDNSGRGVSNCDCDRYSKGATATLTQSAVSGNTRGGIANFGLYGAGAKITESTISGNTASDGGGVFSQFGGIAVTRSTIAGNTATGRGGGVYNYVGSVTLLQSTISGNRAAEGGGVWNEGSHIDYYGGSFPGYGTLTLTHSTIAANIATQRGGGVVNRTDGRGGATLTLTGSIVAYHREDCANIGGGAIKIISKGYNLDSDWSCELTAPTDQPGADPLLGPLQDNGGPTFTHALLPESPAIDAIPWGANGCGTTLLSDQRGQARPQPVGGACDIGAYEAEVAGQPLSAWVTGLTPHTAVCENVTTGHEVTLSDPVSPWDCEAEGLGVRAGDRVALRVHGSVAKGATDVGGAVVGMAPRSGDCTNLTTGQQVAFQHMVGATAASCVAAGLGVHPGDTVQMHVQGVAE
jgi:hypothetical protein